MSDKTKFRKKSRLMKKSKAIQDTNIPTKISKKNSDIFSDFLTSNFYKSIVNSTFLALLKLATVTSVYKEGARSYKNHYSPVSI